MSSESSLARLLTAGITWLLFSPAWVMLVPMMQQGLASFGPGDLVQAPSVPVRTQQSTFKWKGPFGALHTLPADFEQRNHDLVMTDNNETLSEEAYWVVPHSGKKLKIHVHLLPEFLAVVDLSNGPSHVTKEIGGHIFDPYASVFKPSISHR